MSSPSLRLATAGDVDFLFRMANDPDMIAARFDHKRIGWCEHRWWMLDMLADPNVRQYIAEVDGEAVGEIRLDWIADGVEVGLVVDPAHRGNGYGSDMILEVVELQDAPRYTAHIAEDNEASKHAFFKAGFLPAGGTLYVREC